MQTALPNLQLQGTQSHGSLPGANKNAYMNFSVHTQYCEILKHNQFTKDSHSWYPGMYKCFPSFFALTWHVKDHYSNAQDTLSSVPLLLLESKLVSFQFFLHPLCPDAKNRSWTNKSIAVKIGFRGVAFSLISKGYRKFADTILVSKLDHWLFVRYLKHLYK